MRWMAMLLVCTSCFADIESPESTTPFIADAKCQQWQRVCKTETHCTSRSSLPGESKCYNCTLFGTFGTGQRPTTIRVCDKSQVYQLQQMQNYRCREVYADAPCLRSIQSDTCQWVCIKRPDPNSKALDINLNNFDQNAQNRSPQ